MFKNYNVKFVPNKWNEVTPVTIKTTIQESRGEFDTILIKGAEYSLSDDGNLLSSKNVYDEKTGKFSNIPYEESDSDIVLRNRQYLAVGYKAEKEPVGSVYRSLLVFNPQKQVTDVIGERSFTVQNATLTLTTKNNESVSGIVYVGLAVGSTVDSSATWESPTPINEEPWVSGGGAVLRERATIDVFGGSNYPWMAPGWTYGHPDVFPEPEHFRNRDNFPCIYLRPGRPPARSPFIDLPPHLRDIPIIPVTEPPTFIQPANPNDPRVPIRPVYIQPWDDEIVRDELYFWQGRWWRRSGGRWYVAIPAGVKPALVPIYDENGQEVDYDIVYQRQHLWEEYVPCWGIRRCRRQQSYTDGTTDPPTNFNWEGFGDPPWEKYPRDYSPFEFEAPWFPYGGGTPNATDPPPSRGGPGWIRTPNNYDPTVRDPGIRNREPGTLYPFFPRIGEDDWKIPNPWLDESSQSYGEQWYFDRPPCNIGDPLRPWEQGPGFQETDPFPPPPPPEIPDTLVPFLEDIAPMVPWTDIFPIRTTGDDPTEPPQNSIELIERINTYLNATTSSVVLKNSTKAVFDITGIVNEWFRKTETPIRMIVWSPNLELEGRLIKFESSESTVARIGDGVFQTCKFLSTGDTTNLHTAGVRCILKNQNGNLLIKTVNNDPTSSKNFMSFQTLVPIGSSFELRDPDINNKISLGTNTCVVVDRPEENSVVVSGVVLPAGVENHETTLEFLATVQIPGGVYILDIGSPSEITKIAFNSLNPNDEISVQYSTFEENNNSKIFSIKLGIDETKFNSRYRLYLNEMVISEDRTLRPTEIVQSGKVPTLKMDLLLS